MTQTVADCLKCPVCDVIYEDPVITRCNHTMCRKCAGQKCPVCDKTIIGELAENTLISKLIKSMFKEARIAQQTFEDNTKLEKAIKEIDEIIELIEIDSSMGNYQARITSNEAAINAKITEITAHKQTHAAYISLIFNPPLQNGASVMIGTTNVAANTIISAVDRLKKLENDHINLVCLKETYAKLYTVYMARLLALKELRALKNRYQAMLSRERPVKITPIELDGEAQLRKYVYAPHVDRSNAGVLHPKMFCDGGGYNTFGSRALSGLLNSNAVNLVSLHPLGDCHCLPNLRIALKKKPEEDDTLIEYMSKYKNSYIEITFPKPLAVVTSAFITLGINTDTDAYVMYKGNEIITKRFVDPLSLDAGTSYLDVEKLTNIKSIKFIASANRCKTERYYDDDVSLSIENVAILNIGIFGSI